MIEAFPEDCAPRFMVRDHAGIYGELLEKLRTGGTMEEERRGHLLDIASRKVAPGPGILPGVSAKPDAVAS